MPLSDPRQCPECDGDGVVSTDCLNGEVWVHTCFRCDGAGVVCNLCDKGQHDCECGGAAESYEGIKPEERR